MGAWPAMTTLGTASTLVMTTTEEFYTKERERGMRERKTAKR